MNPHSNPRIDPPAVVIVSFTSLQVPLLCSPYSPSGQMGKEPSVSLQCLLPIQSSFSPESATAWEGVGGG
jgi:hypothetical protein